MVKKLLILILLFLPIAYAADYYADIDINVDEAGFVTIDGSTNHPNLLVENSQLYTSKEQSLWLLNITKQEEFSDYVYSLNLPGSASINYIKSSGFFRIESTNGKLHIKGFGENKPFSILVQYQIKKTQDYNTTLIILAAILTIIILFFRNKSKTRKKEKSKKPKRQEIKISLRGLTSRQKKIVMLLIDTKKPLTQARIQSELKIPKASISRNIRSLELKGLVEKEKVGMSNIIRLKH